MHATQFGATAVGGQHAHGTRSGAEGTNNYAGVPVRVRAEESMGIGGGARGELVGVGHPVFLADLCRGKQAGPYHVGLCDQPATRAHLLSRYRAEGTRRPRSHRERSSGSAPACAPAPRRDGRRDATRS
jgi:hypothetical protein